MTKDKIDVLLKEWVNLQECRSEKMKQQIRVKVGNEQFYARLTVTNDIIIIEPADADKSIMGFRERHLNGCKEVIPHGLKLVQRFAKPPVKLFFRTAKQRERALKRIRDLIGFGDILTCFLFSI